MLNDLIQKNQFNNLSKGCQLCQQGKWLCIFLTYKCNANCLFCPAPFKDDRIQSAFGNDKEEILSYLLNADFEGISFSGGDPFVVFERLLEWFTFFKKNLPNYYYWAYTSGLNIDLRKLERIASEGMNEIRFNIAATGYLSEQIWKNILEAKKLFTYVSIEIPSITDDYLHLQKAMMKMECVGIDYLNLHDYILSPSDSQNENELSNEFILNKTMKLHYSKSSVQNTLNVIKYAKENNLHFQINHCSMQQKEMQMQQRRLKFGKIFYNPDYDLITEDGTLRNYYCIPNEIYNNNLRHRLSIFPDESLIRPYIVKIQQFNKFKKNTSTYLEAHFVPQIELNQERILLKIKILK